MSTIAQPSYDLVLARSYAVAVHNGQKYGVHDYMYHIDGVVELLHHFSLHIFDDVLFLDWDIIKKVGYLHDVLEDVAKTAYDVTAANIRLAFEPEVTTDLLLLKHDKTVLTYIEYTQNIVDSDNIRVMLVKLADSLFNLMNTEESKRITSRYTTNVRNLSKVLIEKNVLTPEKAEVIKFLSLSTWDFFKNTREVK